MEARREGGCYGCRRLGEGTVDGGADVGVIWLAEAGVFRAGRPAWDCCGAHRNCTAYAACGVIGQGD